MYICMYKCLCKYYTYNTILDTDTVGLRRRWACGWDDGQSGSHACHNKSQRSQEQVTVTRGHNESHESQTGHTKVRDVT